MKTKETEAKEIMNRVVLEYYLVKKGETFEEFLQSKIPNTIDSVTKTKMELLPFRKMDTH